MLYVLITYSCQRPFIYEGINIYYVEHRILQLLGHTAPHRMKTSRTYNTEELADDKKTFHNDKID